jgi:hypothetical protein
MLDVYWDLRPCAETQDLYKSKGLKPVDYWFLEIKFLTESSWTRNQEFCELSNVEYLLDKYKETPIRLDERDKELLRAGWYEDLSLHNLNRSMLLAKISTCSLEPALLPL